MTSQELPLEDENNELFVHYQFEVDKGQELMRIDKYLMNFISNISRNRIQGAAKSDGILVNDKPVKSNYKVRPNDVIKIVMPNPVREIELIAEEIPLDIQYEDNDLMVIMKQAGLVVHPGHGNHSGTLVNGLLHYYETLPNNGTENNKPGLVHRLDKDTTGLMVIAKTENAMTKLAKQFFDRTVHRRYHALVWGDVLEDEGTIEGHIGRNPKQRIQMMVFPDGETGKHAITTYKVIRRYGYITHVSCKLLTGRTHQIRAHFKHIKHPLFGDFRYGGDKIVKGTVYTKYKQFVDNCFKTLPRQALHAKELGFVHPTTGEEMMFDSPLPEDMATVLDKWERYTSR